MPVARNGDYNSPPMVRLEDISSYLIYEKSPHTPVEMLNKFKNLENTRT